MNDQLRETAHLRMALQEIESALDIAAKHNTYEWFLARVNELFDEYDLWTPPAPVSADQLQIPF